MPGKATDHERRQISGIYPCLQPLALVKVGSLAGRAPFGGLVEPLPPMLSHESGVLRLGTLGACLA